MKYNFIVIGAGIVGLATGLKLLERNPGLKLVILEKEKDICRHQTGNNSGVIHSGIYYKPGSLKAKNCVHGYKLLLDFCDRHNVKYEICGKVIAATAEDQIPAMDTLFERGIKNGLTGLKKLNDAELREIEPMVNGIAGIFVPQTGIINFTDVARKYAEQIKNLGGEIIFNAEVKNIIASQDKCEVITARDKYSSEYLISCAGLQSDRVAKMTHPDLPLRIIPFRGEYYKLREEKKGIVKSLIYPVPDPKFPFLGVHFTRMIDGKVEAGPNAVLSFKREGYNKFDFSLTDAFQTFAWPGFRKIMGKYLKTGLGEFYRSYNKNAFVKALRKLVPAVEKTDLVKGGAGVRAQACDRNGGLLDDFYIVEDKRIFHVCNAPSPAATASLAIGEHIAGRVLANLN